MFSRMGSGNLPFAAKSCASASTGLLAETISCLWTVATAQLLLSHTPSLMVLQSSHATVISLPKIMATKWPECTSKHDAIYSKNRRVILRKRRVKCNCIVYRRPPPMDHSLSQIYPIDIIAPYLCMIQFDIILHPRQCLQSRFRQST
jgi:hypothetical protein